MESDLDKIQKLLDKSNKTVYSSGPRTTDEISAVENELGVKFPSSFREFLAKWGTLSIGSKEYYGITTKRDAIPDCSWFTRRLRQDVNLPKSLVVVVDDSDGDEYICIDCSREIAPNECATVAWDNINRKISDVYEITFSELLKEDLKEYLE